MTVTGMRELEEVAVKLEASARKPALDDGSRRRVGGAARGYRFCI